MNLYLNLYIYVQILIHEFVYTYIYFQINTYKFVYTKS